MSSKQPSYVDYINNFWRVNDEFQFSSSQAHCYFILLSLFNRKMWVEELALSDLVLCELMGVSINTMRGAKKVLMEQGLIHYVKGGKGYGNVTTLMIDLICARADRAVITHGTTNFKFSTLASAECYGAMVGDRLRAMFNFIVLDGGSRRK